MGEPNRTDPSAKFTASPGSRRIHAVGGQLHSVTASVSRHPEHSPTWHIFFVRVIAHRKTITKRREPAKRQPFFEECSPVGTSSAASFFFSQTHFPFLFVSKLPVSLRYLVCPFFRIFRR